MGRALVERCDEHVECVLSLAIEDALRAAGMTPDDAYYVRVSVIELVDPDDPACAAADG